MGGGKRKSQKPKTKLDCFGRDIDKLLEKETQMKEYEERMIQNIRKRIQKSLKNSTLFTDRFHIIAFNTWVTTLEREVYPAEIGFLEVTLKDGISKTFTRKIKMGTRPLGYHARVLETSKKSHGMTEDQKDLSEDYEEIIHYIRDSITCQNGEIPSAESSKYLPIYTVTQDKETVEKSLEWLFGNADYSPDDRFIVYDLGNLLYESVSTSTFDGHITSVLLAQGLMEEDRYLYGAGVGCEQHEESENLKCALIEAHRYAFTFFKYSCPPHDIPMKIGYHCSKTTL